MILSDSDIEKLLNDIYLGIINLDNLPENLYVSIFKHLNGGVGLGVGGGTSLGIYSGRDAALLNDIYDNVMFFSGAKTFGYVAASTVLLQDNKMLNKQDVFDLLRQKYNLWNISWLEAEYNTAIGQGQMLRQWSNIIDEQDVIPLLMYDAVLDKNTSPICRELDGIIKPVLDPFWRKASPLNHYNCRCQLRQVDSGKVSKKTFDGLKNKPDSSFDGNVYFDKQVFSSSHPYFTEIPRQYKEKAKRNFDLPLISKNNVWQ